MISLLNVCVEKVSLAVGQHGSESELGDFSVEGCSTES